MNDEYFMNIAIEQAKKSRDSDGYHVGAVIVKDGRIISVAYSDETKDRGHAEELAIKIALKSVSGATIYSTMEPCSLRPSRRLSCSELIIRSGIARVVYGTLDPEPQVPCDGVERLIGAGIKVIHLGALEKICKEITPSLF